MEQLSCVSTASLLFSRSDLIQFVQFSIVVWALGLTHMPFFSPLVFAASIAVASIAIHTSSTDGSPIGFRDLYLQVSLDDL